MAYVYGDNMYVSDMTEFRKEISAMFLNKVVLVHGLEIPVDIMQVLKSLTDEQIYGHDIQVTYWNHDDEQDSSLGKWRIQIWQMKENSPTFALHIKLDDIDEDGKDYKFYYLKLNPPSSSNN